MDLGASRATKVARSHLRLCERTQRWSDLLRNQLFSADGLAPDQTLHHQDYQRSQLPNPPNDKRVDARR